MFRGRKRERRRGNGGINSPTFLPKCFAAGEIFIGEPLSLPRVSANREINLIRDAPNMSASRPLEIPNCNDLRIFNDAMGVSFNGKLLKRLQESFLLVPTMQVLP